MARLTNKEYLLRRKFLQELWNYDETQKLYSLLSPNKQQSLHLYYATSKYNWTDEEALEYRKRRDNRSAFSSGKAFNELYRIVVGAAMRLSIDCKYSDLKILTKKIPQLDKKLRDYNFAKQQQKTNKNNTGARVLPLMRQEIDIDKLAKAMIMLAKDMAEKKNQAS